jgi:hypothetical protein
MLRAAGLEEVGFRAVCPTYIDGGEDNHTLLVSFAKLHGAALVADGLVAAGELAVLVNELEAHLADPATITLDFFAGFWAHGHLPPEPPATPIRSGQETAQ